MSYGEKLQAQLQATQQRLQKLTKLGARPLSVTDPDSRFLRESGGGFTLGYTVDLAVSDNASLLPWVEQVEQTCGARPAQVSADSGFFSVQNLNALEPRGIEGYVPDAHFSGAQQGRCGPLKTVAEAPAHRRLRARRRSPAGRARYRRRQAWVEPVIGMLKEQRGMRRFRLRGLRQVGVEVALTCTAFNLSCMGRLGGEPNRSQARR